jgi:hypothetical protein
MCLNDNEYNERLTVNELRKFRGFEEISDSEAENVIDSLVRLAMIMYNVNKEEL